MSKNTELDVMNLKNADFLKQVKKHVLERMKTFDVNCATVAECMGVNRQYLRCRIERITGVTGAKYMLSIRIEHAKKLLTSGKYSIVEVADICGYSKSNNFCRTFKREVGMKASEYVVKHAGV